MNLKSARERSAVVGPDFQYPAVNFSGTICLPIDLICTFSVQELIAQTAKRFSAGIGHQDQFHTGPQGPVDNQFQWQHHRIPETNIRTDQYIDAFQVIDGNAIETGYALGYRDPVDAGMQIQKWKDFRIDVDTGYGCIQ